MMFLAVISAFEPVPISYETIEVQAHDYQDAEDQIVSVFGDSVVIHQLDECASCFVPSRVMHPAI